MLHCSLTQSTPVPLPIQGLWDCAAARFSCHTAAPRAAKVAIANRHHCCGVSRLRQIARPAKRPTGDLKWAMSFHGREVGGVSPEVNLAPAPLFSPPAVVTPHGGAGRRTEAARSPRQTTDPSGRSGLLPSAPVTRPLGNFREGY